MFKIIKLELFDSFQCLMGKCQDNCCDENWLIYVDDEIYELYQKIGIRDLDSFVSAEKPHVILKRDGKCPFITAEGLCLIHKELGEEYLCNTCKSYPRFVSTYAGEENDLFIENIGLSCPAAAEWVVGLERVCRLEEEVFYESPDEVGKEATILQSEANMKNIVSVLQEQESFEKAMTECYRKVGGEYYALDLKSIASQDLLLRNISICYLFENLMLESKKDVTNYPGVLDRICDILKKLDEAVTDRMQNTQTITNDILSDCLYKIMRKQDH